MEELTALLGESRQRLLRLVNRRGETTAVEAADELDLAVTTVRQHLQRLEDDGLLERNSRPQGRGRPTLYFRLTERARRMYPSADGHMLRELLEFLGRQGHHRVIDEFFRHYWQTRSEQLEQRLADAGAETLEQRLEVLDEFLAEQGFMPEIDIREDGTVVIRECNCPLRASVESTRLPCRLEAQFLEDVVGRLLERVEYIPEGHPACVYEFDTGCCGDTDE